MATSFSPATIDFLNALKANNNKPWFVAHERDYRAQILEPLQSLVEALSDTMLDIDSEFETTPVIGKTISRIYRDTRFSKDKSLFRSALWVTFKRPRPDWQDAPGYFFEVAPEHYRYGMGMHCATRDTMDAFRSAIATRPDEFRRTIAFLSAKPELTVGGDLYKKTLNPDIPADLHSWYQRKTLYLICTHPIETRLFDEQFARLLAAEFQAMAPLYHYMWTVKGFPKLETLKQACQP